MPENTLTKHFTASIFIFHEHEVGDIWKLLLVHHKKFDGWMIPGGHIETNENSVQAAFRIRKY